MKSFILQVLEVLVPSAYIISNKTVLTLHNFKFPSIFISWQLTLALLAIMVHFRNSIHSVSRSDVQNNLVSSVLLTVSMYFGSRALGAISLPVFISGQILGEQVLKSILHFGNVSRCRMILWLINVLFMISLFTLIVSSLDVYTVFCFLTHIAVNNGLVAFKRSLNTHEEHIKHTVVSITFCVVFLLLYGTVSGEVVQAGNYNFSQSHFIFYLSNSGILCAAIHIINGSKLEDGKLNSFKRFTYYIFVNIIGYFYDYNGDGNFLIRDSTISLYFSGTLLLDSIFLPLLTNIN